MQEPWIDDIAKVLAVRGGRRGVIRAAVAAALGGMLGVGSRRATAAATLFPNLKIDPAEDLAFGQEQVDDKPHQVLRFAAAVWNAGPGPLEVRGDGNGHAVQVLYDDAGGSDERRLPQNILQYHAEHGHWHFDHWAHHALFRLSRDGRWTKIKEAAKQSFCIWDDFPVDPPLPNQARQTYTRCYEGDEQGIVEGLSVGWVDRYPSNLPGQWFDLGERRLPAGKYQIRSTVDPLNLLAEGGRHRNADTAQVCFAVDSGGAIRTTRCRRA